MRDFIDLNIPDDMPYSYRVRADKIIAIKTPKLGAWDFLLQVIQSNSNGARSTLTLQMLVVNVFLPAQPTYFPTLTLAILSGFLSLRFLN